MLNPKTFYFKAQSLDNTSNDHHGMVVDGLVVVGNRHAQDITDLISTIAIEGRRVFNKDGVTIDIYKGQALVQAYPHQRDNLGRISPILCCGPIRHLGEMKKMIGYMELFATHIGRTIIPNHIDLLNNVCFRMNLWACIL